MDIRLGSGIILAAISTRHPELLTEQVESIIDVVLDNHELKGETLIYVVQVLISFFVFV